MAKITTSFICTVLNEEKTIDRLLRSLSIQTIKPDEIIIVDGGSSDGTVAAIQNSKFKMQNYSSKFKILVRPGNRAVGRNEAIKVAKGEIILCSDSGCELDKNWVKELTLSFKKNVDVVSGYYKGVYGSFFQKSLIPYVLVMEDKVNEKTFLPATRSMAFRKAIWKKIGGFPEKYSHNEDYVFAKRLKKQKARMVFNRQAIVYWFPPDSVWKTFRMFYRFALGDAEAGIVRPKVVLVYIRYILGLYISVLSLFLISILFSLYLVWATLKNYKYVQSFEAFIYLPVLQLSSDIAVLLGSTHGLLRRIFSMYTRKR